MSINSSDGGTSEILVDNSSCTQVDNDDFCAPPSRRPSGSMFSSFVIVTAQAKAYIPSRVAIVVFLCSLGAVVGAVFFFIQLRNKDSYQFSGACHTCIDSGLAWDYLNETCQMEAKSPSAFSLTNADFCGAEGCQSMQPTGGVRPTPYWVVVSSIAFATAISSIINICKRFLVKPLQTRIMRASIHNTEDALTPLQQEYALILSMFGAMDPYWWFVLYVVAVVHLVYLCYQVNIAVQFIGNEDLWQRYEAVNLMWIYSGTVPVLTIWFAQLPTLMLIKNRGNREVDKIKFLELLTMRIAFPFVYFRPEGETGLLKYVGAQILASLPLLPFFITHVVPGLFIFLPIAILIILAAKAFLVVVKNLPQCIKDSMTAQVPFILLARIVGGTLSVFVFQTFGTYAVLFYRGDSWVDAISSEYAFRSTACYVNAFLNSLQPYDVGLIGLLLS